MEFDLNGRKVTLNKEPKLEHVEMALGYEQDIILSIIDINSVGESDKETNITELLSKQLTGNPVNLRKYMTKQKLAEPMKTIMLCTGLSASELKDVEIRPLFLKCKEVLGGNASSFFAELDINIITT